MYCKNCGNQMADTAAFCNKCGTAVKPVVPPVDPAEAQKTQSILVHGILGLALSELPIAGIILSKKAKKLHDAYMDEGGINAGRAKVGRILANVGHPLSIVFTIGWALYGLYIIILLFIAVCMALGIAGAGLTGIGEFISRYGSF